MRATKNQLINHPMIKHPRKPRQTVRPTSKVPENYVSTAEIVERSGRSAACVLARLNRSKAPKIRVGKKVYWSRESVENYLDSLTADLFEYLPNGYVDVATALKISGYTSTAALTMLFKRGKVKRIRYQEDAGYGRKTRYGYNLLDLERHLGLTSEDDYDRD